MVNICVLGSSTLWTPGLLTDLITLFDEQMEVRLIDIDPKAAVLCAQWGEAANRYYCRKDRYMPFTDRRKALEGADAVLITLSTGGLDAMEHDLVIPEKYGIYATVGDTTGPGGWSRSIRNIPVFMEFARDFEEICPQALIVNYTNPMSSLTGALANCCSNPVVGLCHAYFETKDFIQKVFNLEDWSKISISVAGMNHFTWVTDFKIGKEYGYRLLRERIGTGSIRDIIPKESTDEIGIYSRHDLCIDLFDTFGYIPYPADRHICEFVSFALCGSPERYVHKKEDGIAYETVRYCSLQRTSVEWRRSQFVTRDQRMHDWISGKLEMPKKSRETGSNMIYAYLYNKPFNDAVNVLNIGQIPGLPLGSCVETMGLVDGLGVRPVMVEGVPEYLLEVMRPQAICQKWITEGVIEGNTDKLFQALYRDPQCIHLKPREIRAMGLELLEANSKFIPKGLTWK